MGIRMSAKCIGRSVFVIAMVFIHSAVADGQGFSEPIPSEPIPSDPEQLPAEPRTLSAAQLPPNSIASPTEPDSEPIDAPVLSATSELPASIPEPSDSDPDIQPIAKPSISKKATSGRGDALDALFEGKGFLGDKEDVPKQIAIRVRLVEQVNSISIVNDQQVSEMRNVVAFRTENVNVSDDLSPEQRLGVIIALQEKSLAETHKALIEVEDDDERGRLLSKLRDLYTERFEIDTEYQDYKVRKIERRAAKLRADVDAREKALSEWVDAMVTLAKVRASGIETMPATVPPSLAPPGGFNTPGFAPLQAAPGLGLSLPSGVQNGLPSTSPVPNSLGNPPSFRSRNNRLESY